MKYLLSFIISLVSLHSFSQNVAYVTPEEAVALLLGEGVIATNITYTGTQMQIGEMSGFDGTGFPIGDGVILSSADVVNVVPPGGGNDVVSVRELVVMLIF
jgi:hypothetical protein